MATPHGIALAVHIIKSHFGDLVPKVCGCLLRRGSLSLQELIRFTRFSSSLVKNCLLVLIQHNCVQAFSTTVGFEGGVKPETQYMALFDNIINRLRFPKFLIIVKDALGPECEDLFYGLLQNGRLTFEQLVTRASSGESKSVQDVRRYFNSLVKAHYVERCPKPEPFIEPNSEHETASARKRAKSGEQIMSIEQQAIIAASLLDAERFSEIMDTETDTISDTKVTEQNHFPGVGDKRKPEALEMDKDVQTTITETEVLWRANFEKFICDRKKKACVANIRSRISLDAGTVLEAMIESTGEQNAKNMNSVKSSMDAILKGVRGKPGGTSMTLDRVRIILEQLDCDIRAEDVGVSCSIDLKHIFETCRTDEVEVQVLRRYGQEAYRIFRLLVKENGCLVMTDRISDLTFVEMKETQGILYKLWKDDYVDMEKAVSHETGQKQLFLWRVNKNVLWEHILNDMYHAALNLSQRIAYMVEQHPEIWLKKRSQDSQRMERTTQLQNSWKILQSSLSKLEDALMLFHDF